MDFAVNMQSEDRLAKRKILVVGGRAAEGRTHSKTLARMLIAYEHAKRFGVRRQVCAFPRRDMSPHSKGGREIRLLTTSAKRPGVRPAPWRFRSESMNRNSGE